MIKDFKEIIQDILKCKCYINETKPRKIEFCNKHFNALISFAYQYQSQIQVLKAAFWIFLALLAFCTMRLVMLFTIGA